MGVWFYQRRTRVLGPVSSDELRFLALSGKVLPETLIRAAESDDWLEYSQSPVALVSHTRKCSTNATADKSQQSQKFDTLASSEPRAAADRSSVPYGSEYSTEERGLRIVSVVAVLALIVLAMLLSTFWRKESPARQFAGTGSAQHTEASDEDRGVSAGGPSGGNADATDAAIAPNEESLPQQNPVAEEALSPMPSVTTLADAIPGDESQTKESTMVEDKAAAAEDTPGAAPVQEAARDSSSDRFGVALAPRVEANARDKNAKSKASRAALQESNLAARTGERRKVAIEESGGTIESEKAVARALEWLRRIQRSDGSWDFVDPGHDAKQGSLDSPLGATAMATLCFLGAGSTTRTGPDKDLVKRAFEFMISQEGTEVQGTDSMYVHALVTLCLTELVTMEPDEKIYLKHAVNAVRYIEQAQDPVGGGWRYAPQSPGDTSVTGWDVLALQSAQSTGIKVDEAVVSRAQNFLDAVSDSGGAAYAYTPGSPATNTMTAVGLLCRMYLGWPHDNAPLRQGIHRLSSVGTSRSDMYYNYYATMALHHFGGPEWEKWNPTMRNQLVMTQLREGAAAGSWPVTDPHGGPGGQVYQTCLSVLTLEVYYRYLPLYRQ